MKIAVINGPNLNMLGIREPGVYGNESLTSLINSLKTQYPQLEIYDCQSNNEGELITAIQKLMKKMSVNISFFDLIEINEAFAATSVAVQRSLKIDPDKLNIVGGAIALGHPIGCSGTRIVTTLAHQLKRTKKKFGVASMCIGGGQGLAMAIEKL